MRINLIYDVLGQLTSDGQPGFLNQGDLIDGTLPDGSSSSSSLFTNQVSLELYNNCSETVDPNTQLVTYNLSNPVTLITDPSISGDITITANPSSNSPFATPLFNGTFSLTGANPASTFSWSGVTQSINLYLSNNSGYNFINVLLDRTESMTLMTSSGGGGGGSGTVTSVTSSNSDIGVVNPTVSPILTLNSSVSPAPNKIVKLNSSGQLGAIDVGTNSLVIDPTTSTSTDLNTTLSNIASQGTSLPSTIAATPVTQYSAVYLIPGTTNYAMAQANSANTSVVIGIATEGTSTPMTSITIQYDGVVTNPSWNWAPSTNVFLSATTSGGLTQTVPAAGNQLSLVGVALSATQLLITPVYNGLI